MARPASKKPSKKTSTKPASKKPSKRSARSKKASKSESAKSGWERLFEAAKELNDLDPSLLLRGGMLALERMGRVIDTHGYRKLPTDAIRIGMYVQCANLGPVTFSFSGPQGQHLDIFGVRANCEPKKVLIEGIATKAEHARWKAAHEGRAASGADESDKLPSMVYRPPSQVNNIDASLLVPPDWAEYVHLKAQDVSEKNPLVITFSPMFPTSPTSFPPFLDLTFFAHDTEKRDEMHRFIQTVGYVIRQKAMADDEVWDEDRQTH